MSNIVQCLRKGRSVKARWKHPTMNGFRHASGERKLVLTPKQLEQEATVKRIRQAREAELVFVLPDDLRKEPV